MSTRLRFPTRIQEVMSEITADPRLSFGIEAMNERVAEFSSPIAAKLVGIALNQDARTRWDDALDALWRDARTPREASEIIIGGGLHAAIYCAVRVQEGHPKPLVIEAQSVVGGAFATTRRSSFYLNSRNRPGRLGVPGRDEALNFLPGAPVQPADLSGDEYQTNDSVGFAIRATLAAYANVISGRRVVEADSTGVTLDDGKRIKAARVIYATGLGELDAPKERDGKRLIDYFQFLKMLETRFPFQGLDRVAVVGEGDGGRTVIEALIGQGPSTSWSVASLDFIEQIDWYGVNPSATTRAGWETCNRSRYKGIGRALPRNEGERGRVNPISRRAGQFSTGFDGASIDGIRYDLVVWAGGFTPQLNTEDLMEYRTGGRVVARMKESGVFVVGPAAQLPNQPEERNLSSAVPENTVALFRYADRTATFARHLPQIALAEAEPVEVEEPIDAEVREAIPAGEPF